jgi:hypothetical protein
MTKKYTPEYRVRVPIAQICATASTSATCTSEALYGEQVTLLEKFNNWALIRQSHDGYEGFIQLENLEPAQVNNQARPNPTHWVSQRSTLLFSLSDLKGPIAHRIPFASELALAPLTGSPFSQTACGYFVWTEHCLPLGQVHTLNPQQLAESFFLGAPYRWGGRSPEGADCSGLIQLLARSQGLSIPRDSGDQELFIEKQVAADNYQALDIAYWPGHTGLLIDNGKLLHATAHTLSCIIETLDQVVLRAGPVSSIKRLFS